MVDFLLGPIDFADVGISRIIDNYLLANGQPFLAVVEQEIVNGFDFVAQLVELLFLLGEHDVWDLEAILPIILFHLRRLKHCNTEIFIDSSSFYFFSSCQCLSLCICFGFAIFGGALLANHEPLCVQEFFVLFGRLMLVLGGDDLEQHVGIAPVEVVQELGDSRSEEDDRQWWICNDGYGIQNCIIAQMLHCQGHDLIVEAVAGGLQLEKIFDLQELGHLHQRELGLHQRSG